MVIVMDDEDRENEGDLLIAAEHVRPRQEPGEQEAVRGQPGKHKRGEDGRRAGQDRDRHVPGDAGPDQPVARIGYQRRPRIRYQRHGFAIFQPSDEGRPRPLGVVVVIGDERRGDAVDGQQPGRHPGVLAGDDIGGLQDLERPERNVGGVADGGGDQAKTRRRRAPGRFTRAPAVGRLGPGPGIRPRRRFRSAG